MNKKVGRASISFTCKDNGALRSPTINASISTYYSAPTLIGTAARAITEVMFAKMEPDLNKQDNTADVINTALQEVGKTARAMHKNAKISDAIGTLITFFK